MKIKQNEKISKKIKKCYKIWKKSNPQNRNLQKNKQILFTTSPKTSNPQAFKKPATPQKKQNPISRENRKVDNVAEQQCFAMLLYKFKVRPNKQWLVCK